MKRLVVGDIHGCFDELQDLLDAAGLGAEDEVVAVGDMLDRGPQNGRVAAFFTAGHAAPAARVRAVMGNHERKLVDFHDGALARPALAQRITRRELGPARFAEVCGSLRELPRFIALDEAIVVHGFYEPGVPLEQQREDVLLGRRSAGRYLREQNRRPWYELYDGKRPLIVGHLQYGPDPHAPFVWRDESSGMPRVFCLDTGCVGGGRLTGLVLPDFTLVSVPSRGNHWERVRAANQDLAYDGAEADRLTWAVVDQVRARDDGAIAREWRARVLTLSREIDRAIAAVRPAIEARHAWVVECLGGSRALASMPEEAQARAYSAALGPGPLSAVLRRYRRTLDLEHALRCQFRGPQAALDWAAQICASGVFDPAVGS